jgi:hypothetical protein
MANQKLNIDIVARDKSKQALNNVQGNLSKVKQSVFNLRNAFIGLGAGVVIKGFVDAGIQIENLGVQLKALFGSAREGKKALKEVTDFASGTPFELKNIQQGITALATVRKQAEANGVSFEELLKITGNTATLLGNDFALASLQVQRSFSAGIASAELFRERGVKSMAGFKEGVRVNTKESIKGLSKAFGTGGEFGNLTEELAKTLFGTVSNIKDAFFLFQVEVSKGFFGALKENLGDLKSTVEDNRKTINEFAQTIGTGLSKAIQGTANVLKFFQENIKLITEAVKFFLAFKLITFFLNLAPAIRGATIAMLAFNKATRKNLLIGGISILLINMGRLIEKTKEYLRLAGIIDPIQLEIPDRGRGTDNVLIKNNAKIETLSGAIKRNFKDIFTTLQQTNSDALGTMQLKLTTIGATIGEGLNKGIKTFSDVFARSVILGEKLSESFKKMAQQLGVKILGALIEILARKSVELAIEKLITREKQKQAMLSTSNALSGLGSLKGFFGMAKGGAVSKGQPYVVGENGPEMFVPNSTGQITQNARGTGNGGATTVNFNINTVDASGFEELLVRSRGTITQLINNAVNERGSKNLI